jgi:starvation-inducible DNA-binding protein
MKTVTIENVDLDGKEQTRVIPNIDLDENTRHELSKKLSGVLADTFCLMTMNLNYHWNVRGPLFKQLHEFTEEQYNSLFSQLDDLAERIRALGFNAPGTLKDFNDNTKINLPNGQLSDMEMVVDLLEANEQIQSRLKDTCEYAAEHKDYVTEDMMIGRMQYHEKVAWMLRSYLEK